MLTTSVEAVDFTKRQVHNENSQKVKFCLKDKTLAIFLTTNTFYFVQLHNLQ